MSEKPKDSFACHELKTWPEYFEAVAAGRKPFEIRENDRGFRCGDVLDLREWSPETKEYTGRRHSATVSYVTAFAQQPGYVVLGLERADQAGRMRGALEQIEQWSRAYPLDVFPEPDFAQVAVALKAAGLSLDQVSASNMRHVVDGVGKIARAALSPTEPEAMEKT